MNLDSAIFPSDDKTVEGEINKMFRLISMMAPTVGDFVESGNKITIEVAPDRGFISIQMTSELI